MRPASLPPGAVAVPEAFPWRWVLGTLWRRRWLVLLGPVLGVAVVGYLVWRTPATYRASTLLRIADARRALTGGIDDPGLDGDRIADEVISRVQLLRSRNLASLIVDSAGLRLRPDFARFPADLIEDVAVDPDAPPDTLELQFDDRGYAVRGTQGAGAAHYGRPVRVAGVRFTVTARPPHRRATWVVQSQERAIDDLLEHIKATRRAGTNIVDLSFTAPRPAVAQQVVNTLARTFQELDAVGAQELSRRRREFLDEQLHRTDSMLAVSQLALSSFRSREQVFSSADELAARQEGLLVLSQRRGELLAQRQVYATVLAQLGSADPATRALGLRSLAATPSLTQNPAIRYLYDQLLRHGGTLDSLTAGAWSAAPTHPDVQRLKLLIESTEQQLVAAVRSEQGMLGTQLGALGGQQRRSGAELENLPAVEAREVRLRQDVETIRKMGDVLREEHQRARMAEAVEVGTVEIVDVAALPYEPVPAYAGLKLAFALIFGFVLGGGGALLLESGSTAVRRREDLDTILQVPALGITPHLSTTVSPRGRLLPGGRGNGRTGRGGGSAPPGTLPHPAAEAYRVLRTNLMHSPEAAQLRVVVITSATPGEGKSTTAANMAAAFAAEGMRVLLVDADVWHGRLHRVFGVDRGPGFAECLRSDGSLAVAPRPTAVPNLFLVPRGGAHVDPRDLLVRTRLHRVLDAFADEYDLVLCDAPPLLASADAAILAAAASGVVLVVRAGQTEREAVQAALRQLGSVGARVLGAVLNDPAGVAARYGDPYYTYGYGYGAAAGSGGGE